MKKSTKLWDKGIAPEKSVENFTVGKDRELDLFLAPFDVLGSIAHITMLKSIGLLTGKELLLLKEGLLEIYQQIEQGTFKIAEGVEDVHSQVELLLTEKQGELGKKIHSGRSRNDQVLLDLRLFMRAEIQDVTVSVQTLFNTLMQQSEKHKDKLMPGYTHFQVAMPSSFGLWFGAYAESLVDDLQQLLAAYRVINKNPLGSAAGYGSSFPLDRQMTTELLGFNGLNVNSVYAQMARGKSERIVAQALASIAETLGRMAMDIILFMSQNYSFISFPNELTTGSSIMPHKKNPDLFEILRARCNRLKALPNEFLMITANLPSGYHRDFQLIKEHLIPAFAEIKTCLKILDEALKQIVIKIDLLDDPKFKYIFSVDAVNAQVKKGMPFRDAYRKIAEQIESDDFTAPAQAKHTHIGSMGNLGNDLINEEMQNVLGAFGFKKVEQALTSMLSQESPK